MKIKGLILAMALCSTITMGAQGAGKFVPFKYGTAIYNYMRLWIKMCNE